ncbi:4Fe-4S binding protein [Rugamonas rubra]|uniref:Regulator of nitric oxide reductase transcription n=1 Tax=Rugamonas rubra TaxID=758825 RepID=A0A1I4ULU8_9BURK|nr:4Fe-4S binding protein [Rugamonas rubra]SFM89895.1 Regulator of nitric oxide reductase transcription [Rugamonas rubra]
MRILFKLVFTMLALLMTAAPAPALAGVMTHDELVRRFPAPLIVGQKDAELAAWPLFKQNATATELVGYVFESADLAPIPGFSGVPPNMLVTIDTKGGFLDVVMLSQHEPVFLDGLGEGPLLQFVKQYQGLSLKQSISIETNTKRARHPDAAHAYIDGVSKATASVRIINQSVLAAALKVARKKLGFAAGRDPDMIARVRQDVFDSRSTEQLLADGLVAHLRVSNRDVEKLFAGSPGAGLDAQALQRPDEVFIDLYLAYASVPSVGRNVLTARGWTKLKGRLDDGDHAMLVMSTGRHSIIGEEFVRGSVSDRLLLKQDGLPIDMRDLDLELALADSLHLPDASVTALRIISQAGLDPGSPMEFSLPITRSKGIVYPERFTRELKIAYRLPARFYLAGEGNNKSWQGVWGSRRDELLVLGVALAVLALALAMQRRLSANGRRFAWFRAGFLAFTVGFVGYYAQGQLSIVNLTGVAQALLAGRGLEFLLFDPMTVVLWLFVALSLLLWGRGTFCGWLCPFGALQELTGKLAQWLHIPQLKLRGVTDARLKILKYVLLALIMASTLFQTELTDKLVELEPFKTAITLNFVRSWPYVAYAVGLLLASSFVYKFFCRYLCPFGAALALLGRVRLLDWIPRRSECGTPCQTCRHRCDYQAIKPDGKVVYEECFQCLDCVVIYESDEKCAPLMLELKRSRTIPIMPVQRSS